MIHIIAWLFTLCAAHWHAPHRDVHFERALYLECLDEHDIESDENDGECDEP